MDPIRGGFTLLIDALRFYKLQRERAVRVLFVAVLLPNLAPSLIPLGEGFSFFANGRIESKTAAGQLQEMLQILAGVVERFDTLDGIWLGVTLLAPVVSMFCALIYANLYVDELQERTDGKPVLRTFRSLPRLALLYLATVALVLMGASFFFVPSAILVFATCLTPLMITAGGRRTMESALESVTRTNRFKMRIAFLDLTVLLVVNLPASVIELPFLGNPVVVGAIGAFFGSIAWLMLGRLHARLYHILVVQPTAVLPSANHPT